MPEYQKWDWSWMLTAGRVYLHLSYDEFWHQTSPRMFEVMIREFVDMKKHTPFGW